jgi:dTDP-4-amino-4,6-dideoxygalactose transaminase
MQQDTVDLFEKRVADFFGAPYGIAVDCCTHGIELCLRYVNPDYITLPCHTALSVLLLVDKKLKLNWGWKDEVWEGHYELGSTKIHDAAILWGPNTYLPGALMVVSFQSTKHLDLARGGMILTDDKAALDKLKKMSYGPFIGRRAHRKLCIKTAHGDAPGNLPMQNLHQVDTTEWPTMEYHYHMSPQIAELGLSNLPSAIGRRPREYHISDWSNLAKEEINSSDARAIVDFYGLHE